MATVAWFIDRLYLPKTLEFGDFAVIPLTTENRPFREAVNAYAARFAMTVEYGGWSPQAVDVVVIVYSKVLASTVEDAISATVPKAMALASALAYRQLGRGLTLGALVDMGDGQMVGRYAALDYRQVIKVPFVREQDELLGHSRDIHHSSSSTRAR